MKTKAAWTLVLILTAMNLGTAQSVRLGMGGAIVSLKQATVYSKTFGDQGYGFGPTVISLTGMTKILSPWQRLNIVLGFSYIPLSSTGWPHLIVDESGGPFGHTAMFDSHATLIAASIGPEWYLLKGGIGPHVGLHGRLVHMSSVVSEIDTGPFAQTETLEGWTRVGVGITGGIEIAESPRISIDIRGQYNFDWLFQQGDGEPGLDAYGLEATVLYTIL